MSAHMLAYTDGWLFVGLDGRLYRLTYDPDDWHAGDPEAYPKANGWTVEMVGYIETESVFPPWVG